LVGGGITCNLQRLTPSLSLSLLLASASSRGIRFVFSYSRIEVVLGSFSLREMFPLVAFECQTACFLFRLGREGRARRQSGRRRWGGGAGDASSPLLLSHILRSSFHEPQLCAPSPPFLGDALMDAPSPVVCCWGGGGQSVGRERGERERSTTTATTTTLCQRGREGRGLSLLATPPRHAHARYAGRPFSPRDT
jgi:hypothetical protein